MDKLQRAGRDFLLRLVARHGRRRGCAPSFARPLCKWPCTKCNIVLTVGAETPRVLEGYFDASKRESGDYCVAGFAFAKPQAKKFDREWRKLFAPYGGRCHMTDLANKAEVFKGITQAEARRLIVGAVDRIDSRISFGVAASCNVNETSAVLPRWVDGFQHPYPVCCHFVMTQLGMKIADSGHDDDVAYFFENGDEFQGAANRFMSMTLNVPRLRESYKYRSHAFIDKKDAVAFDAADMLAWEWTKYQDETMTTKKRKMRQSLANMLVRRGQLDSRRYGFFFLTGEVLLQFADEVTRLGMLEREERAKRAFPFSA